MSSFTGLFLFRYIYSSKDRKVVFIITRRQIKALELIIRHAKDWSFAPYENSDKGDFTIDIADFWWHLARLIGGMNPWKLFDKWEEAGFPSIIKR